MKSDEIFVVRGEFGEFTKGYARKTAIGGDAVPEVAWVGDGGQVYFIARDVCREARTATHEDIAAAKSPRGVTLLSGRLEIHCSFVADEMCVLLEVNMNHVVHMRQQTCKGLPGCAEIRF